MTKELTGKNYEIQKELSKANYKMQKELIELKHKYKMEELKYTRENAAIFHEKDLEKIRIKSAEIRKGQMRKEYGRY